MPKTVGDVFDQAIREWAEAEATILEAERIVDPDGLTEKERLTHEIKEAQKRLKARKMEKEGQ